MKAKQQMKRGQLKNIHASDGGGYSEWLGIIPFIIN